MAGSLSRASTRGSGGGDGRGQLAGAAAQVEDGLSRGRVEQLQHVAAKDRDVAELPLVAVGVPSGGHGSLAEAEAGRDLPPAGGEGLLEKAAARSTAAAARRAWSGSSPATMRVRASSSASGSSSGSRR